MAQADLTALYEAAKAEGQLTVIALPATWCAYGEAIAGFKAKYPEITVNELNPDAGSADEIEAIRLGGLFSLFCLGGSSLFGGWLFGRLGLAMIMATARAMDMAFIGISFNCCFQLFARYRAISDLGL